LSGGVDSSCAAAILKESGYDVIGVTFKMWPKEECGELSGKACCSLESIVRARSVAESLKIPYYVLDLSREFREEVIAYFVREYQRGATPNPCVVCNEKIKFGYLLDRAKRLGADRIATGHYAKVERDPKSKRFILKEAKDRRYDQSYFLFRLKQDQLSHCIFPLENMTKAQSRRKALKLKLITGNAKSSQDICFAQEDGYEAYLLKKMLIRSEPGDIVDTGGRKLGVHKGIPFYTVGQRRGLGIAYREPLYVLKIDAGNNRIIVGTKEDTMKRSIIVGEVNWISVEGIGRAMDVEAKIRYAHAKAPAVITKISERKVRLDFNSRQEAPTPGQAAVFYRQKTVVGGGWIKEVIG